MSEYITTQQAAALLNTTDRTIRRRLSDMSVKRPQLSAYVRREHGNILIDIRLVRGNFERIEDEPQPKAQEPKQENSTTDIVKLLTDQLEVKDSQIKELQERNREQNIIIANMQQERQNLLLSSPIPQPLDDLNNTEKLNNNSTGTARSKFKIEYLILAILAAVLLFLILIYTDAAL
jgi:hypothetical protein